MALDNLLEQIWSDTLEERNARDGSPISHLLTSLLAAPVLLLVDKSGTAVSEPFIGYGGFEILPGASLADVLLEEMGIEIDETTVVLVEPKEQSGETRSSTDELGRVVGKILVELSKMGSDTNVPSEPPRTLISATSAGGLHQQTTIN